MGDTLLEAHRIATAARTQGREELTADELRIISRLYTGALVRARSDNPPATAASWPGIPGPSPNGLPSTGT